ncbi:hypothetical protein KC887_03355 [Candidatus Kaiserbacteria bacterium]|nr:hypothetical protein [Candidatus Kaiserbacteria bacterium]
MTDSMVLIPVSDEQIAHAIITSNYRTNQVLLEVRGALEKLGDNRTAEVQILGEEVAQWTANAIDKLEGYAARMLRDYMGKQFRRPDHMSRIFVERTARP